MKAEPVNRGETALLFGGALIALVGVLQLFAGSSKTGVSIVLLGAGLFVLGAFAPRMKRMKVGLTGFEADLLDKPHGRDFIAAAVDADDHALAAVIPVLRDDIGSGVARVGHAFDGRCLSDPELQWIRKDLNVQAIAIKRPGESKWAGGGRITMMRLPAGSELALVGDQADVDLAVARLAAEEESQ